MSHLEQQEFVQKVKTKYPEYFRNTSVLEFGSLYVNGTVRDFFDNCNYSGVDLSEGSCVDIVSVCKDFRSPYKFDVVISCEMLEHDATWRESLANMYDLCGLGGLIVITCATTGRPEHGTTNTTPGDSPFTNDYYLNLTRADIESVWDLTRNFVRYELKVNEKSHDLQFWGIKSWN